jgi:S1-C subfamily serine protease
VSGVLVLRPPTSGPLGHAGLKVGDVIRVVDGKPIDVVTDLPPDAVVINQIGIVRQQQNQMMAVAP